MLKAKAKANRTVTLFLGNREEYEYLLIGDGAPHLKMIIQLADSQEAIHLHKIGDGGIGIRSEAEDRGQRTEDRRQKAEGRGRKAEGRGKREEGRRRREEGGRGCIKSRFENSHGLQSVGYDAYNHAISTVSTVSAFSLNNDLFIQPKMRSLLFPPGQFI